MQKRSYTWGYVSLILGATIGAGFASGQEIVTFFARFGYISIFFAIVFFVLFTYSINSLLNFGKNENLYQNFKENKFLNSCLTIIFFVVSANMLAGANVILNDLIYDFQFPLYSILILITSFVIINKGFNAIFSVNKFIVPIMILFTVIICISSFFFSPHSDLVINFDIANLAMLSTSSILYSFCNVLIISGVVMKAGKTIPSKNIKKVSIISGLTLCLLIILIVLSLLINDNSLIFTNMPMIYLAFLINKPCGYLYSLVILCSILTTMFATLYSLNFSDLFKKSKNNFFIYLIVFALSLFGFQKLIEYSYPLIGAFGIIIILQIRNLKLSNNLV